MKKRCAECGSPVMLLGWGKNAYWTHVDSSHDAHGAEPAWKPSVRERRAARIAAALPIVAELRGHEAEVDGVWWSRHSSSEDRALWLATPISHGTREESALADSNYEVAERMLTEASSFGEVGTRDDLWPGGRIETLLVRSDDAGALVALQGIVGALEDGEPLDSEHHDALEDDRNHPSKGECYGDGDCGCEVAEHRRKVARLGEAQAHASLPWTRNPHDGDMERACALCDFFEWEATS
jgi:hypothetical protein